MFIKAGLRRIAGGGFMALLLPADFDSAKTRSAAVRRLSAVYRQDRADAADRVVQTTRRNSGSSQGKSLLVHLVPRRSSSPAGAHCSVRTDTTAQGVTMNTDNELEEFEA